MNRDEEYKARAEGAKREADRSPSELDRQMGLRIMEEWLVLLRKRPRGNDETSQ